MVNVLTSPYNRWTVAAKTAGKSFNRLKRWCCTVDSPGWHDGEDNVTVSSYVTWTLYYMCCLTVDMTHVKSKNRTYLLYAEMYNTNILSRRSGWLEEKKGPFLLRNGASWTPLKGDTGPQRISYMQPSRCILHHDLAVWSPDDCNTAKVWAYGGSRWDTRYSACENLPTATRSRILCGSLLKVESFEKCKWIRWAAQFTCDSQKQEGVEGNVRESPFKNGLDWSWQAPPRYLKCHHYKYTQTHQHTLRRVYIVKSHGETTDVRSLLSLWLLRNLVTWRGELHVRVGKKKKKVGELNHLHINMYSCGLV